MGVLTSVLFCIELLPAQMPQRIVTLHSGVSSIGEAVKSLAQQSGTAMKVDANSVSETVFLEINKRPTSEVMEQLASTTNTRWRLDSSTWILERPKSVIELEVAKDKKKRLERLQYWQGQLQHSLDPHFDSDGVDKIGRDYVDEFIKKQPDYTKIENLKLYDPVARTFARVFKCIDFNEVVRVKGGGTIIFSTKPTPTQHLISFDNQDPLKLFKEEQALWSSRMTALTKGRTNDDGKSPFYDYWRGGSNPLSYINRPFQSIRPLVTEPERVLVSLTEYHGHYAARFSVLGKDGKFLVDWETSHKAASEPSQSTALTYKPPKALAPSKTTLAFWSLKDDEKGSIKNAKKLLEPYLRDPEKNDLLKLGNQERLMAIANSRKKSIVACIPDDCLAWYSGVADVAWILTPNDYCEMDHNETEKWITFFPKNFLDHWSSRLDRKVLKQFGNELLLKNKVSLSTFAKMQTTDTGNPTEDRIASSLEGLIPGHKGYENCFGTPGRGSAIRLFTSLSLAQLTTLRKGNVIPYNRLSSLQLDLAKKIVFDTPERLYEGGQAPNPLAAYSPTFELPNGIFDGKGVAIDFTDDDVLVIYEQKNGRREPFSKINLVERKERPATAEFYCGTRNPTVVNKPSYEMQKQKSIILKCYLSSGHYYAAYFTEPPRRISGRVVQESQLRPSVKKFASQYIKSLAADMLSQ